MTATTAPVKSFDALRESVADARVTRNKKARAATTAPAMTKVSQSNFGLTPVNQRSAELKMSLHQQKEIGHTDCCLRPS
jgi:hypothetical protein